MKFDMIIFRILIKFNIWVFLRILIKFNIWVFLRILIKFDMIIFTDFNEIWYINIFQQSVKKIQVSLTSDKNKGYFTWRPM